MHEKKSVSREYSKRYKSCSKRGKSKILDEFVELTRYRRDYASFLLRNWGRRVYFSGGRVLLVGDLERRKKGSGRKRKYDRSVLLALLEFWELLDYPCGKRLRSQLGRLIEKAIEYKEVEVKKEVFDKLIQISSATIDRLLKPERKRYELKPRARTRPGTLLKRDIPIRTGVDWNEDEVGYIEIDLVSHDGGNARGDFCQTLDIVDIKSGWVDFVAVKNKAQRWVFEALMEIRERLPFHLKGIDSDNGAEFINHHLLNYCKEEGIKYTRSRPSRKNDNCYIEQKNYTAIRSYVGYYRYDTDQQREVLNELYSYLRLYINYFQPMMKLRMKQRIGSKIIKRYDEPKTPYQRIIDIKDVSENTKNKLKQTYQTLNPFELKRNICRLQDKIFRMAYLIKRGVS